MNDLALIGLIMNTPIPTPEQKTAARLSTLGLILPTVRPLVRTDLPPALILVTYPHGLLGSEPRREREHAWWESGPDLRQLVRGPEWADPEEFVLTRATLERAFRYLQRNPFVITGAC